MHYSLSITFDAADDDEARARIASWSLDPGLAVTISSYADPVVATTDDAGGIVATARLTTLDPPSVTKGDGEVEVHAHGSGFTDQATIVFDGVELPTAFVSASELYFTVDADPDGHAAGTFPVGVRQNGTDTPPLSFTIQEAAAE